MNKHLLEHFLEHFFLFNLVRAHTQNVGVLWFVCRTCFWVEVVVAFSTNPVLA